ncbi:hypothetical protein GCM10010129_79030 [Streptomyces fumigatiscleroticus]|nr:hypothetical protein GCM10010129_79030 [Streptomyces fumigatiscleroticus]
MAARPQRPHRPAQGLGAVGDVDRDQPGVHEVEGAGWWRVGRHVVTQDLDHAAGGLPHPGHVDVGGDRLSGGADALGRSEGDQGAARADPPAPHAGGDPEPVDVAERHRVEELGEAAEADACLGLPVVQQVTVVRVVCTHTASPADGRPP